jgi:hypothetical protein
MRRRKSSLVDIVVPALILTCTINAWVEDIIQCSRWFDFLSPFVPGLETYDCQIVSIPLSHAIDLHVLQFFSVPSIVELGGKIHTSIRTSFSICQKALRGGLSSLNEILNGSPCPSFSVL